MKRLALATLLGLMILVTGALPATAGFLNGDCTATAVMGDSFREDGSALDSKNVATATEADPFLIDPSGSVAWNARSDVPIKDHTWSIGLVIGGSEFTFFSGGDPNTAGTQTSTGKESIKDRLNEIEFTQMGWILDQVNGKLEAWGRISGAEMTGCDGRAWVEIDGSFGVIGLIASGTAAVGGGMILRAGVRKKA